jgi:hypothetical protein
LERHPFPGPGLGIRCLCSDFDAPVRAIPEGSILPVSSVGVQGDSRTYAPVLAIDSLDHARATALINSLRGVNRVVAGVELRTPLSEMQVRACSMTPVRIARLRRADAIVRRICVESDYDPRDPDSDWDCGVTRLYRAAACGIGGRDDGPIGPDGSRSAATAVCWGLRSRGDCGGLLRSYA